MLPSIRGLKAGFKDCLPSPLKGGSFPDLNNKTAGGVPCPSDPKSLNRGWRHLSLRPIFGHDFSRIVAPTEYRIEFPLSMVAPLRDSVTQRQNR